MSKYVMRNSEPSFDNKYYLHTSSKGLNECIHIANGSVLPNCVGYAWGRFYELLGSRPKLSRRNAEDWYGYSDGYERGQVPKLGAVACWRRGQTNNGSDGAGHVAIVEQINSDGSIVTSNSSYGGKRWFLKTFSKGYVMNGYVFQGFIYNPSCEKFNKVEEANKKLYLPASATSWRVYPLDRQPVKGNEKGFLRPSKFGGLTYDILGYSMSNVAIIQTRDFGKVQIYIAPSTGAIIK